MWPQNKDKSLETAGAQYVQDKRNDPQGLDSYAQSGFTRSNSPTANQEESPPPPRPAFLSTTSQASKGFFPTRSACGSFGADDRRRSHLTSHCLEGPQETDSPPSTDCSRQAERARSARSHCQERQRRLPARPPACTPSGFFKPRRRGRRGGSESVKTETPNSKGPREARGAERGARERSGP